MAPGRPTPSINRRRGYTLAESLVASVVLAISVVSVSSALIASHQQNYAQQDETGAVSLARELMEEIASRPLSLPDGTAGFPLVTDRTTYDTINDFDGYTDTVTNRLYHTAATGTTANFASARPPVTVVTTGLASITLTPEQYSRTVSVTYPTWVFGTTVTSGDFALVTVTVCAGGGSKVTVSRLFGSLAITR